MTKPYTPQPGTIPHRVIEYLRRAAPGTSIATAPLADELDVSSSSILPCMGPAIRDGLVKRERVDGIIHWSLGDGTPPPAAPDAEDDHEMKSKIVLTPAAVAKAAEANDKLAKRLEKAIESGPKPGDIVLIPRQVDLAPPEPVFGAFSDGSLSIEQGGTFLRLGEKHAQALQAFMGRAWSRG